MKRRSPLASWPVVLVLACATSTPSAPPSVEKVSPPEAPLAKSRGVEERCPPPPPPPSSAPVRCGDGVAESVYERIDAPCIPDHCCAEGWIAGPGSEECDGADLRSQSCRSRGFLAGTLKCSLACKFDESACTRASEPSAKTEVIPSGPQCVSGHLPALAAGPSRLGLAYPNGTGITFSALDLANLSPVGGGTQVLGGGYDQSALAEWASPHGPRTTTGTVLLAALDSGWLAAVQRYGDDTSTAVVRIHRDGKIDAPVTTVRGRPLFLIAGKGGALLGYEGTQVELLRLGADGSAEGDPVHPFTRKTSYVGQFSAAARPVGSGWRVAVANAGAPGPIETVSLSSSGEVSAVRRLSDVGTEVRFADGEPSEAVILEPTGLFAVNAETAQGKRRLSSTHPLQLLAAERSANGLSVWVESSVAPTGTGVVTRIEETPAGFPRSVDLVSIPQKRPCAADLRNGTLWLWFGDENRRGSPTLFRQ